MTETKVQFAPAQVAAAAPQAPGAQLTIPKKWKHSGLPGSITATRVHYPQRSEVFGTADQYLTEQKLHARQETLQAKVVARLGQRPEWNASVQPPNTKFPDRPLTRTISENQGLRQPYNFRAEVLPDTYRDTVFLPAPNKFQYDRARLLPEKEREKLTRTNVSINTRVEPPTHPNLADALKWNVSTQVHANATHPYLPPVADCRPLTKTVNESLVGASYIGPREREHQRTLTVREMKRAARQQAAQEALKDPEFSFTLSNMAEHSKHSPFAAQLAELAASRQSAAAW